FNRGLSSPVHTLALQSDGKILVGIKGYMGTDWKQRCPIYRLNTDGSTDLTFLVSVEGFVNGIVVYTVVETLLVQADGKILVGGYYDEMEGEARLNIGRLNSDGTLDDTFNPGAGFRVYTLALQEDGKILVGGAFNTLGGETRARIGRLNPDGTIDDSFNPGADGSVRALAVQADDKILVGGSFTELGGETHYSIGRLNTDGTLDNTFP
ncbi:unnamed protein product, partial [marine sediment metagenome]